MVEYVGIANDPLAQSVEHLTFNQGDRSSSLRWVTKKETLVNAEKSSIYKGFSYFHFLAVYGILGYFIAKKVVKKLSPFSP